MLAAGRFAPSPSGPLHLGNLRTALLAWCFARSRSGRFLLRIEDLDPQRSRREHEQSMVADLERLGLDWDGALLRQSEQLERHRAAFEQLRADGRLYRCWCTRAEIREALEAPHGAGAEGAYPGTCRRLSGPPSRRGGSAAAPRRRGGSTRCGSASRSSTSSPGEQAASVDDFVVWRSDPRLGDGPGLPAYNLAVVVDDAAEGIGEVVRGDDLAETTPRQILLARALGLAVPRYAHVPLVLAPDGRRLAKRDGAVTLGERLALGESVEAVVGWMASSPGLAPAGTALGAGDVLARFDPALLGREPTRFDPAVSLRPAP